MTKKIIKLSTPWGHGFLKNQVDPTILDYSFEIDTEIDYCDYWIIWGDLPSGKEKIKVNCPKNNVFYLTDEAHSLKYYHPKFLEQFQTIISGRQDLQHKNIISTHEINTWHFNKTFEEVHGYLEVRKTKNISVVCSDLTELPGHKKRYAFVNKLIGHFKDRLDVYGRGFNSIDDKWEALAPYKYSIAIENSAINGYFTEKLTECYLAHTFPIYYGAPDIHLYFQPESLLKIDIDDYKSSINSIEKLLNSDHWQNAKGLLSDQKNLYLKKYQLYNKLLQIIRDFPAGNRERISIKSHRSYLKKSLMNKIIDKILPSKKNNV